MSSRLEEYLAELDVGEEAINRYGLGIPFALAAVGVALIYRVAPGLASFGGQNEYAKVGIVVITVAGVACLIAAGYAYNALDTGRWLRSFPEDSPEEVEAE